MISVMKVLYRTSLFFFVLLMVAPGAFAKYVAVLETMAAPAAKEKVSSSDRIYLTDVLRSEAVKILPAEQNFTIMTRENINVMLPPGKSIEDCEGSCLAETGKNISADYVAQARVGTLGSSLTLSVEIYETKGNKLVASFNGDGETVKDLLAIIKQESPDFFRRVKGGNTGFDSFSGIGAVSGASGFSFAGSKKFIVEIVTEPAGALPTVDGKGFQKCTSTPCKVQVEAGEHRFVASKDRYDDAESLVDVKSNNQQVVLKLNPNYGVLDLRPVIEREPKKLRVSIDGKNAKAGKIELDPGLHQVSLSHPCYDPVEFQVAIAKNKTETFDHELARGIGGLRLNAEWKGEPQAVPVFIDGAEVGSTPFEGEVPLCASVAVGEQGAKEAVNTPLRWHEVVEYTHQLQRAPQAVVAVEQSQNEVRERAYAAYDELDGKTHAPKAGESIPANVEAEKGGIHWVPVGISAAVAVAGTVMAVVGNANAKSAHDKRPYDIEEYQKNKDDIHSAQTLRMAGIITAIVGAVGVGVSFAF